LNYKFNTKIPNSKQKLFLTFRTIFVHNMFSPSSAKRRASDKALPVPNFIHDYFRCRKSSRLKKI
jgi:hypothetical protein